MTGAPKPNSNTTQREERVPLQKAQLHQHVKLKLRANTWETRKEYMRVCVRAMRLLTLQQEQ